jgi:putative CocE/NonD family hydrolase
MKIVPKILSALALLGSTVLAVTGAAGDPAPGELAVLLENPLLRQTDLPFLDAPVPDQSRFVTMPDGIRLAVSIYFPKDFDPASDKAPAVFEDSIYGRSEDASTTAIDLYRAAGYVVVIGDARGFAASFGSQRGFNTRQQTADEAEMIRWIAAEPWSNGKVAAIGHSVSAVFADSMTSSGAPALRAAIIRASDFDEYAHNMFPGGQPNLSILSLATELMAWHAGADCGTNLATCAELGFTPVDGDASFELLQEAIRDHADNLDGAAFASIVYRDDVLGDTAIGGSSGMDRIESIRSAKVPARVSASWMDGVTALSALTRFTMASEVPMEVVIGATTHAGGLDADPFSTTPFEPAVPSAIEQFTADIGFLDRALAGEAIGRSISYIVLGADTWKTTNAWPPSGVTAQTLNLAPNALTAEVTASATGSYTVDPASTSGLYNRWAAQRGGPIFYGDRRMAPGTRMTFDGLATTEDQELVGAATLCLAMSSDQSDGLVIAYLEDVAPDGRVTYLTEGILRLLHRGKQGCDASAAQRSFSRADGAPVVPGETMRFALDLLPVAALIRKGHHLRLSLAGSDAGWFDGFKGTTGATWTVGFGGDDGSTLQVPLRDWIE